MSVDRDTPLHYYFALGDVEIVSAHRREVGERELYDVSADETARIMADSLHECGADLLRSDFTRLPYWNSE